MATCAIIPVKETRLAKCRLKSVLTPEERAELTLHMLSDVLHALTGCGELDEIYVVSKDERVREISLGYGCAFMEEEGHGLLSSVRRAVTKCFDMGFSRVFVVHSDLPLLTSKEVLEMISHESTLVLAPSKSLGTTGVLIRNGSGFTPLYGRHSFARNVVLAATLGVEFEVYYSVGFLIDLDLPQDIVYVLKASSHSEAKKYLKEIEAESRVLHKLAKVSMSP